MNRSTLRTWLLLSLAVPVGVTGVWALAAPASWYADFPGFGRDWIAAFGPYDEHLARDFGSAYVALAALLLAAAVAPGAALRRTVPAAFLVFAVPHFAFHVAHVGDLPLGDDVVNMVLLAFSVVIPAVVLARGDAPPVGSRRGASGARLGPAPERHPLVRVAYRYSRKRFGHVTGPVGLAAHHPRLLGGYAVMELTLEGATRVDTRLEDLAATRAATLIDCPYCIDFGSALMARHGYDERQLRAIADWRASDVFSDDERLVLEYADAMSETPAVVPDDLFERLRARFDDAALVELTFAIAVENARGRFNHAFGLGSEGVCRIPVANGRRAAVA